REGRQRREHQSGDDDQGRANHWVSPCVTFSYVTVAEAEPCGGAMADIAESSRRAIVGVATEAITAGPAAGAALARALGPGTAGARNCSESRHHSVRKPMILFRFRGIGRKTPILDLDRPSQYGPRGLGAAEPSRCCGCRKHGRRRARKS